MESSNKRPKNLGILMVVGGPGGSGATTIAKMLARHFTLNRIYAGGLMREYAVSKGYSSYEDFLKNTSTEEIALLDEKVDKKMLKLAYFSNVLIDSKVFAALATKYRIPTTVKIWLDSSIETRAKRKVKNEGGVYQEELRKLQERYQIDKERFERVYSIDYSAPKKYNDIVIDTSKMNEYQTLDLILKLIENGGYISK